MMDFEELAAAATWGTATVLVAGEDSPAQSGRDGLAGFLPGARTMAFSSTAACSAGVSERSPLLVTTWACLHCLTLVNHYLIWRCIGAPAHRFALGQVGERREQDLLPRRLRPHQALLLDGLDEGFVLREVQGRKAEGQDGGRSFHRRDGRCRLQTEFTLRRRHRRLALISRASSSRLAFCAFATHAASLRGVATRATCWALVQPTQPSATASRNFGNRSSSDASRGTGWSDCARSPAPRSRTGGPRHSRGPGTTRA